jgi:hypothetical protein
MSYSRVNELSCDAVSAIFGKHTEGQDLHIRLIGFLWFHTEIVVGDGHRCGYECNWGARV